MQAVMNSENTQAVDLTEIYGSKPLRRVVSRGKGRGEAREWDEAYIA